MTGIVTPDWNLVQGEGFFIAGALRDGTANSSEQARVQFQVLLSRLIWDKLAASSELFEPLALYLARELMESAMSNSSAYQEALRMELEFGSLLNLEGIKDQNSRSSYSLRRKLFISLLFLGVTSETMDWEDTNYEKMNLQTCRWLDKYLELFLAYVLGGKIIETRSGILGVILGHFRQVLGPDIE